MAKIINWKTNETIIEDENLSMKELVEKAVKEKISLAYAKLWCADLSNANFSGGDFRNADFDNSGLYMANFEGADLRDVNFHGTSLGDVNLRNTKLNDSTLWDADIEGVDLTGAEGIQIKQNQLGYLLEALGVKINY